MNNERIEKLLENLPKGSAVYLTDSEDMLYYAAFSGEGAVVVSEDSRLVITDGRYTEAAEKQCIGFEVLEILGLYDILKSLNVDICVQEENISHSAFLKLNVRCKSESIFFNEYIADSEEFLKTVA